MDNSYYILKKKCGKFSPGSLFELTNSRKFICVDNNAICEKMEPIVQCCNTLDKKSLLLLKAVSASSRLKLLQDDQWDTISKLDVGDDCSYLMGANLVSCCIVSKHFKTNGIFFTVILKDGLRLDTTIDRLKLPQKSSNSTFFDFDIESKTSLDCKTTKNVVNFYEELNKPNEKRRRDTVPIDCKLPQNSRDKVSKCGCLTAIFKNAESLQVSSDDKEKFFNNLFNILPHNMGNDDEKTVLHWAAYYLLTDAVQKLMKNEDLRNKKDNSGNTPLHIIVSTPLAQTKEIRAKRNQELIVRTILSKNVDINIKNNQNDTPLTMALKNADFELLEIIMNNSKMPIILSSHCLSEKTSILECLIKMKKQGSAKLCCSKASSASSENELLLRSVFYALEKSYFNLAKEIMAKCSDMNSMLYDGETLLTKLFKENTVTPESVNFLLFNATFDYEKKNNFDEYPLLLACKSLMLEAVKFLLNKIPINKSQMDLCLDEAIKSYTSTYINTTYQTVKPAEQLPVAQLKNNVFQIAELLIKNGATIAPTNHNIQETLDTCIDQDFAKAVKHLCRVNSDIGIRSSEPTRLRVVEPNKTECSICMDRDIDCSFSCGHTYCSVCSRNLSICPSCRKPISEKRPLYLP